MNLAGFGLIGLGAVTMKKMMTPAKKEFHRAASGHYYAVGRKPFRAPPGSGRGTWRVTGGTRAKPVWVWFPS